MSNKNSTDAGALLNRSQVNKNATNDFDAWSVNNFPELPFGANILDLGCGLGKQLRLFSKLHTGFSFTGTDISADALENIRKELKSDKVTLLNTSFDDIDSSKQGWANKMDLAYSFYAYYYSNDLKKFTGEVFKSLKEGGLLWVVAPTSGTNQELFAIISEFYPIPEKVTASITEFHKTLMNVAEQVGFRSYEIDQFHNQIIFKDAKTLIEYYRNTTFFNPDFSAKVEEKVNAHFNDNDVFYLSKNAISLKFHK